VLIAQGDFATAQAHLERALQITEAQFPPDHVDVLRTLSSIATLNRRRGEHELARKQFEEVLARFERSVGVQHPFATEALLGMGETLKAAGELERAEDFYRAALDNQKGPYAERRVIMAECLEGYADLLRRGGRLAEAATIAARAAAVRAYLQAELLKTHRA
jgi:tetratricopeptide (TPR) repeat protein